MLKDVWAFHMKQDIDRSEYSNIQGIPYAQGRFDADSFISSKIAVDDGLGKSNDRLDGP